MSSVLVEAKQLIRNGALSEAETLLRDHTRSAQSDGEGWFLFATVLATQGRHEDALLPIENALRLIPESAPMWLVHGDILAGLRRTDEARIAYQRAISLRDGFVAAHNRLGCLLMDMGDAASARDQFAIAIGKDPQHAQSLNNLGSAHLALGSVGDAIVFFDRARAAAPAYLPAWLNLGKAQVQLSLLDEAERILRHVTHVDPKAFDAHVALADCLERSMKFSASEVSLRSALALRSDAVLWNRLGNLLVDQAKIQEAIDAYRQAVRLNPPDAAQIHSNILVAMHYDPTVDLHELFLKHVEWRSTHLPGRAHLGTHPADFAERRLRIGYVSPRFFKSAVSFLIEPVIRHHDRSQFEVVCYATSTVEDEFTRSLRDNVTLWRNAAQWSDEQLAQQINDDRIDVLVDLAGHAPGNRLGLFAYKPAVVSVTWLDYFDTTGIEEIDYLISDPLHTPEEPIQEFAETVARMPEIRFCYQPPSFAPPPSPVPSAARGFITFGSFNRFSKLNDSTLAMWRDILNGVPGARLVVKNSGLGSADQQRITLEWFARCGLDPERVELRGSSSHAAMLQEYGDIDIALDTQPYNGGITTLEALWMGVPVICMQGDSIISRQSAAILKHIGFDELVAHDSRDYVTLATGLARDGAGLARLRGELRPAMQRSTLCNPEKFTNQLESLFKELLAAKNKTPA